MIGTAVITGTVQAKEPPLPQLPSNYEELALEVSVEPIEAPEAPVEPSIEDIIASYDWDYETALFIAQCESSLNPEALNDNPATGDYSVGLFQINLYGGNAEERPTEEWLKIPENNISFAYELYSKGGWGHWRNCYNKMI